MGKTEKKIHTLHEQNILEIINGFAWIATGLTCVSKDIVTLIINILSLTVVVITSFMRLYMKFEQDDEMSSQHYLEARSKSLGTVLFLLALLYMASVFLGMVNISLSLDWRVWATCFMGITQILAGIYFYRLEKYGEV